MTRRNWPARVALLIGLAVAATAGPAGPARATRPSPTAALGACHGAAPRSDSSGAWWRQTGGLDASGAVQAWQLEVGRPGAAPRAITLPAEAIASGPVRGVVVASENDGRVSRLRLISTATGCSEVIHQTAAVIRRAILDRRAATVYLHLIRRADRSDLGIWRMQAQAGASLVRILAPLALEPRLAGLGPTWSTALALDSAGRHLAVHSCGPQSCATRVVDLATGSTRIVDAPGIGDLIAFDGDRLIAWAACEWSPCAVVAIDVATGSVRTLVAEAVAVAPLAGRSGRIAVADGTGRVAIIDINTGRHLAGSRLRADELLAPGARATAGIEAPDGWLGLIGPGGQPTTVDPATTGTEVRP